MIPKDEKLRDPEYLKFQRQLPCAYARKHGACNGDVVAAHIRIGSLAGMGQKPADDRTIPLCFSCHSIQHNFGEISFHGQYIRDAVELATALYFIYRNVNPSTRAMDCEKEIEIFNRKIRGM